MKTLYKIPILGMFFEMIFGDFFDQFDALENLDAIDDILSAIRNPKATASLKTLRDTFIPDFIKNYEGKKDTAIGKLIIQDKAFSPEFYNGFK
jgi:Mg2+/Co2+ transporter CorC